jgi:hypothetical protein
MENALANISLARSLQRQKVEVWRFIQRSTQRLPHGTSEVGAIFVHELRQDAKTIVSESSNRAGAGVALMPLLRERRKRVGTIE